jgi:hypothetical protein
VEPWCDPRSGRPDCGSSNTEAKNTTTPIWQQKQLNHVPGSGYMDLYLDVPYLASRLLLNTITHLNKPANGVMTATGIPPSGRASWRFANKAARHKVGLSDTQCVITSNSVSGGGLKMCLFSASEIHNSVHVPTTRLIIFTYKTETYLK